MAAGQLPNPIPAKSVYLPLQNPVVVIGPYFLAQYPIELTVMLDKDAIVTDFNGTVIFRMKSKSLSLHNRRKLMDASGNVLASMSQKVWATLHKRWEIFHGDNDDLLFNVKMSSMLHLETKDVFLAKNTKEKVPDFSIKGCYEESSCIIYLGNTNHIVARVI